MLWMCHISGANRGSCSEADSDSSNSSQGSYTHKKKKNPKLSKKLKTQNEQFFADL